MLSGDAGETERRMEQEVDLSQSSENSLKQGLSIQERAEIQQKMFEAFPNLALRS